MAKENIDLTLLGEDLVKYVLSKNCAPCTKPTRMILLNDPNLNTTDGIYFVVYRPLTRLGYRKKHPFIIHADILPRENNRLEAYSQLPTKAKTSIYWNWILNYTTLSEEHFGYAIHNPGFKVAFTVDYAKVEKEFGPYFTLDSINYRYGGNKDANSK